MYRLRRQWLKGSKQLTCGICTHFWDDCKIYKQRDEEDQRYRTCPYKDNEPTRKDSKACNAFVLHNTISCKKLGHQMAPAACVVRSGSRINKYGAEWPDHCAHCREAYVFASLLKHQPKQKEDGNGNNEHSTRGSDTGSQDGIRRRRSSPGNIIPAQLAVPTGGESSTGEGSDHPRRIRRRAAAV